VIDSSARESDDLLALFSRELGSIRDIYVTSATAELWDRLLAALRNSPWDPELRLGNQVVDLAPASVIFATRAPEADTYDLRITVGVAWLWCHFYSIDEIEFSFQVEQIESVSSSKKIVEFMFWLSGALETDVKLTLEAPEGERAEPLVLVSAESGLLQLIQP
jgi:hypothetical protein